MTGSEGYKDLGAEMMASANVMAFQTVVRVLTDERAFEGDLAKIGLVARRIVKEMGFPGVT